MLTEHTIVKDEYTFKFHDYGQLDKPLDYVNLTLIVLEYLYEGKYMLSKPCNRIRAGGCGGVCVLSDPTNSMS